MNLRPFGNTDTNISEVGFGAWAIGDAWGSLVPEEQAMDALRTCFDVGIDFLDTAAVYGDGRSEELIGKALKEAGRPVFVATKIKRGAYGDGYDEMEKLVVEQMRRLDVERIDLIQLHCEAFDRLKAGRLYENMEKLREKGLVRYTGASVETIEEALFTIEHSNCDALQVIFNIFRQRLVTDLFPELRQNRVVAIIARVPLASGVLTGKFHRDHVFEADDHRSFNANGDAFNVGETFAGVPFEDAVDLATQVEDIFRQHRRTEPLAQLALRWILDHAEVSTVIPGGKSAEQVTDNAAATYLPSLSPELHQDLQHFYADHVDRLVRGPY